MTSRLVFSSDELPLGFDDRARHSVWRDVISNVCGPLDVSRRRDLPFSQFMAGAELDRVRVVREYLTGPIVARGCENVELSEKCGFERKCGAK